MKQKTNKLFDDLFKRAEECEKSSNELHDKVHNLSNQVSSISSKNSSRDESFRISSNAPRWSQIIGALYNGKDNCDSDQETPGNEQNANFGFKNANDHININLNANQKENEKNNEKKSLLDKIEDSKNKVEDKKEKIPKLDKKKNSKKMKKRMRKNKTGVLK